MRPVDAPDSLTDADFALDLGDDHWASFMGHGGEGVTRDGQPVPWTEKYGLSVIHRCAKTPSGWDEGFCTFDIPEAAGASPKWTVESWEPLTLSPSLLQHGCGDHGFIRNGRWVRA
jgi:hypothetical protein